MIKRVIRLLIVMLVGISINIGFYFNALADVPCNNLPEIKYQETLLNSSVRLLEILQGISTNHINEIKKGIQNDLTLLIMEIGEMLGYEGCFKDDSLDMAYKIIILLSVYNEKYPVKEWNEDDKILSIFTKAQAYNAEYLKKTRNRDWSGIIK